MKLSNQALTSLMMALQKSILTESDIVPMLQDMDYELDAEGQLFVTNPPVIEIPRELLEPSEEEVENTLMEIKKGL